jgi:hypothetical protein
VVCTGNSHQPLEGKLKTEQGANVTAHLLTFGACKKESENYLLGFVVSL